MTNADILTEIEAIKQLKASYCRLLDSKDWEGWRGLFTDDFHSDTADSGGKDIKGADAFVAFVRSALGKPARATVHQIHAPEIKIISSSEAKGIWALNDIVRFGIGLNLNGYGHYHETYQKIDGVWKIKYSKLTRLREDIFNGLFSIYIANWFRNFIILKLRK
ncbi:MAG: hypothetical protein ACI9I4_000499 [Neolewinella sp.]|jgi:hypothetical protein